MMTSQYDACPTLLLNPYENSWVFTYSKCHPLPPTPALKQNKCHLLILRPCSATRRFNSAEVRFHKDIPIAPLRTWAVRAPERKTLLDLKTHKHVFAIQYRRTITPKLRPQQAASIASVLSLSPAKRLTRSGGLRYSPIVIQRMAQKQREH
jgi:hypothetical protein